MSKARDLADFGSNPDEQTSIITVTVAGGKFVIDGTSQQTITMAASGVYKFDQSDSSNASHPLKISTTSDGTHGGGSAITVDFVAVGTAGSAGAYVTYTIQQDGADNYFYYCGNHSGMGGSIRKSGNPTAAEILTSIKTVDGTGSGLDADTLDGVEAAALLPLSGGTMTGNLSLGDNVKATFGAGSDLKIWHTGSHSYIADQGTGNLYIQGSSNIRFQNPSNVTHMNIADGGDISFYEDTGTTAKFFWDASAERLGIGTTTPATSLDVTGTVQADQFNNDEALPDVRPSLLLDFANSKTLDPRITFTRGSTATYYDGVTTAKAEENLLKYSQDVSNAAWAKNGSTITADNTTAPDGTTTADKVQISTPSNYSGINQLFSVSASTTYAGTLYVKKSTQDYLIVAFNTYLANDSYVGTHAVKRINLTNGGQVGTDIGTTTTTDVGNGWYKVTFVGTTASNSVNGRLAVEFSDSSGSSGTGTSIGTDKGIFVWGAQIEQRSAPTAYTPTTSAPIVKYQPTLQTAVSGAARFDHDPTTGESKGLLIEEARTNLNASSIVFGNNNESTSTTAALLAPDGTLAASKIVENTASSEHGVTLPTVTFASGTTYTLSVFAKSDGVRTGVRLLLPASNFGNNKTCIYNITNGTLINDTGSNAPDASSITDVGNGWYRCTITDTATADGGATAGQIRIDNDPSDTTISYVGNGFNGIFLWGAQIEVGTFPTSYIPTSGSTATRAVDAAAITGSNFTDWYSNANGLTILAQIGDKGAIDSGDDQYRRIYTIGDGTADNYLTLHGQPSGGYWRYRMDSLAIDNAVLAAAYTGVSIANNQKVAVAFDTNDFAISVAGLAPQTDSSFPMPTLTKLLIGANEVGSASLGAFIGTIKKIAIYPKRLPNATLQAMTTE